MTSNFISLDGINYIQVENMYVYTYDGGNGKTVLVINISSDVLSFSEVSKLFHYDKPIYQKEIITDSIDGNVEECCVVKTYLNYSKDYMCRFTQDKHLFEIELTRKSDTEIEADIVEQEVLNSISALIDIYES